MYDVSLYVLYFFIYSFIGWVHEVCYFFVLERRFRNGGIVVAPLLPIYGIGAVAILIFLQPYIHNPFAVFALSAVLASIVEYIGHYCMEKWFHVWLWDYRSKPYNLHGRICLENSLGFGILALFLLYVVHPFIASWLTAISPGIIMAIAATASIAFLIDVSVAWASMINLRISANDIPLSLRDMQGRLDQQIATIRKRRQDFHRRIDKVVLVLLTLHRKNLRRLSKNFTKAKVLPRKKR